MMSRIVIINSHPIQYFAPMYKHLTKEGLDIEVWYCSYEGVKEAFDKGFGVSVKWDIPLLNGYRYRFFKNRKGGSIHKGFTGLVNYSMIKEVMALPAGTIVWLHGWSYFTHLLVIIAAKLTGKKVWLRGESPLNQELRKGKSSFFRRILLNKLLFKLIDKFLYIGRQNKNYYLHYGVKEKKLLFVPYCVDNERFCIEANKLKSLKNELKQEFQIKTGHRVILFSGKYIPKKRPMDILKAFEISNLLNCSLVFVGEGELRFELEKYIREKQLENIVLTGFVNQSVIPKYYAIADVFVMCSEDGETWGLSVNEAMNFNLPVIVSDACGCAYDLVTDKNGHMFKMGDVIALSKALKQVLNNDNSSCNSRQIISNYSYQSITKELKRELQF